MEIRQLVPDDAAALRALRIRAVAEAPSAFAASVEEEQAVTVEKVARQLADEPPNAFAFGALDAGELAGVVNLARYLRPKVRHKAMIGGMFVASERQGRGIGRALLAHAVAFARELDGLQAITLAVTAGNERARGLYARFGFKTFGVEPRYIRVGEEYHDIEWMLLDLRGLT